jgi:RNA polymerase sigma factor (sigma-70 family)
MVQFNLPNTNDDESNDREDVRELQAVLHAHSDRLLAYLSRLMPVDLQSFVEPQDVLQDTFFEAFQRCDEFHIESKDGAFRWLVTIARHRMLAIIRMQRCSKRAGQRPEDPEFDSVMGALEGLAIYSRTPSQSAMSHELIATVQRSMNCLEPQYRDVIQLRFISGLNVKETADRMGRTEGAVLMLCNRGLKALKAQLQSASLPM